MNTESPISKIPSQLDNIPEGVPVVFISYSWDSDEHKQWVLDLANDLRKRFSVYTLLDRYNHGGDDLITFMRKGINKADRVIIIGTPEYKKKLEENNGGGAKLEDQIISISIYHEIDTNKFVPVLREGNFTESFSELLEPRLGYDMSNDAEYEQKLQELAADLWGTPINVAPTLGPKPNFTPAAYTIQNLVPSTPQDYSTIVKMYILDTSKQIVLTEMIEDESKKALNEILKHSNYNHVTTPESFGFYIQIHQKAIENLIEAVIPIVRYGTLEQQKLLVNACVMLCHRPFRNGEITTCGTEYVHLLASTFLFHAIGVAAIRYEKYGLINLLHQVKVPAPNVISFNRSMSLAYLTGCTHWDFDSLNRYMQSSWIYPYSHMVMSKIYPSFSNVFINEQEFQNCYYTWEHISSLLINYYKCFPYSEDIFPIGGFVNKRISLYRGEDDFYTDFFRQAKSAGKEWTPLKLGLFGGNIDDFNATYQKAEDYYNKNRYC